MTQVGKEGLANSLWRIQSEKDRERRGHSRRSPLGRVVVSKTLTHEEVLEESLRIDREFKKVWFIPS